MSEFNYSYLLTTKNCDCCVNEYMVCACEYLVTSDIIWLFLYLAVQVLVTRVTVRQYNTEAELSCLSSCSPAARSSYVWFKNGQKIQEETSSYRDDFHPGDNVSCAFKGHEGYRSLAVCEFTTVPLICSLLHLPLLTSLPF